MGTPQTPDGHFRRGPCPDDRAGYGRVVPVFAIVAPGQGAQKQGFLAPWLEIDAVARHVDELRAACGLDLVTHGRDSDDDTIRDTAVAQPLLVGAALATARALGAPADCLAGHSVGELAAAALAGVLTDEEAMRLVAVRGRAMAQAASRTPTSMTAVLGGDPDEVLAAIEHAGLTAANHNGRGQVVAAGTREQLDQLAQDPPRRARLVPLSVAGAFHTVHMEPAVDAMRAEADTLHPADPQVPLVSNADGAVVARGADVLERLLAQVAHPVRWDRCMAAFAELGVTGVLELAPAGTLAGIVRRNLRGVETFTLDSPDQLDEARAFADTHRGREEAR